VEVEMQRVLVALAVSVVFTSAAFAEDAPATTSATTPVAAPDALSSTTPVPGLSPAAIKEAIASAANKKQQTCYPLEPRAKIGTKLGMTVGCVRTQYSRVVAAARDAAAAYKPFGEADVTAELLGPAGEVEVVGFALAHGRTIASVRSIVVLPKGSKDPQQAIRPTTTKEEKATFSNAFGATFEGNHMLATFPWKALHAGEIHVVYDSEAGLCTDCKIALANVVSKGMSVAELESLVGTTTEKSGSPAQGTYYYGPTIVSLKEGRVAQVRD
jgi:hypothetical protein